MQSYKYKISVIMPVYNSDLYLSEAIESVINQTIGKESIQLIIVNDGSTDNSAEIIKKYQKAHPKTLTYIEKENGGVSSARNEALKHIQGKYVAFLDPDDTVSLNTYKDAFDFFEQCYDKTSVVSFPIYFFGATEGAHPLNSKFEGEKRVANLLSEGLFQLHITASLIKSETAQKMSFKHELVASEDAEALLRILIDKPSLGLVSTARYNYRKRTGSLINTASQKKEWYFDHISHYFEEIMDYATAKYGKIPAFIQNALMYDISWKLGVQKKPACLTDNERDEFINRLYALISRLDDKAILDSTVLSNAEKSFLVAKKHADAFKKTDTDIVIENTAVRASLYPYQLSFFELCGDKIKISCRVITPEYHKADGGLIYVNGVKISSSQPTYETKKSFLGKELLVCNMLDFELDRGLVEGEISISPYLVIDGTEIKSENIIFERFFPIERKYNSSFYAKSDILLTHKSGTPVIKKCTKREIKKHRRAFERELWKSNGFAERKAVIARVLARLYKKLNKRPLWLISDRLSKADDNAEALFSHLNKTSFKGAKYYYTIRRGEDFSRLKRQGRVLDRASLKYKVLFLASDIIISSQAEDFVINPFDYYWQPYKDILADKSFVFLQHGVIKDDLSAWLNKYNKNIKGFVTSARAEYDSILEQKAYHYTEKELWLTGLPRFDALTDKRERIITVMPTWRRYLVNNIDIETGMWKQSDSLKSSSLVAFYNSLLTDNRLIEALNKHDYKILLAPHPNMRAICDFIDTSERVSIASDCTYKELYKKSSLVITDYSSAVFDFAYLGKPIIYAQPDKEEFFSGAHTYDKGYFDYERDGFGRVTYTVEQTVSAVVEAIENGCTPDTLYLDRINKFFAYRDNKCCERVLGKILELGAKNDNSK